MFGTTLKFDEAAFVPSVALMEFDPATAEGTVIVVENPPLEFDVIVPTGAPANDTVIGEDAKKLTPDTATVVPTAPLTGVALSEGV